MPRKRTSKAKVAVGAPNDPEGLYVWMKRYLESMRVRNYSPFTVDNREISLLQFFGWCDARSIGRPQEVTKPILERYQRHLFHLRKRDGKPLSFRTQHSRLVPVRAYFKWLTRQNVLLWNPASELELPRVERRLPRYVLTESEAERVLGMPDVSDAIGLRDRAILEVLYSTGIRRLEVVHLSVYDIDQERGTLIVRQGKGKKDRMVPIGERAIAWVGRYLEDVRPKLVMPPDDGTLFLGATGEELDPNWLSQWVHRYVDAADIGKRGACHLFRHTMATLMLENGADVRYIQEMLGHAELSTTQIYTQVSIRRLKQVHTLTHPGASLSRLGDAVVEANDEVGDASVNPSEPSPTASALNASTDDPLGPVIERPSVVKATVSAEELLARLASEGDEEADDTDGADDAVVAVRRLGA
jgi:integrase/recombinase XerD